MIVDQRLVSNQAHVNQPARRFDGFKPFDKFRTGESNTTFSGGLAKQRCTIGKADGCGPTVAGPL
jgi:hypothetical protein